MLKKPHYIAAGLVVLLSLILLNLPPHAAGQVKLAISSLFLPLFGLSRSGGALADQAGDAATSRSELLREIAELRRTNKFLELRVAQLDPTLRENDQLRQAIGWRKQLPWTGRLAHIIARDPANWQAVRIDLGSSDSAEIRENLPVVTPRGWLVGRISSVGLKSSEVLLVGNPYCKVSAMVEKGGTEKTGEVGVIVGAAGPLDNTFVVLSFLSSKSLCKPGQNVVTTDYGNIFPKGILIGQVAENPRTGGGGFADVQVRLATDLSSLEYVFVLTK
jgi:rod shape-determining protein MreC